MLEHTDRAGTLLTLLFCPQALLARFYMDISDPKTVTISSLDEALVLSTQRIPLIRLESTDSGQVNFIFHNTGTIQSILEQHYANRLKVPTLQILNESQALKSRLFSFRRQSGLDRDYRGGGRG